LRNTRGGKYRYHRVPPIDTLDSHRQGFFLKLPAASIPAAIIPAASIPAASSFLRHQFLRHQFLRHHSCGIIIPAASIPAASSFLRLSNSCGINSCGYQSLRHHHSCGYQIPAASSFLRHHSCGMNSSLPQFMHVSSGAKIRISMEQ
jgi:hypothetical protein